MNNDMFLIWRSACVTDVGKVRTINEDACLDLPELGLWLVADGMGGHMAGDVASHLIVDSCQQISEPSDLDSFIADIQYRLFDVNRNLREMSSQQFNNATIGSTVAALLAFDKQCACVWVGDSRIYRLRNNQLVQLTRDHSMVEEYIEEGFSNREQVINSNMANVLTRAIGAQQELEIDVKIEEMQDGDCFLLCSDGLYKELTEQEIREIMNVNSDCASISNTLLNQALNRDAKDNITVAVVEISDGYT